MKWCDTVKAAIMHGPLPPDVTLEVPHWRQPGMPLLCPTDFLAPAPLKRKRVESRRDPAKQAHTRVPDEAKLWFVDFTLVTPVSVARHTAQPLAAARHLLCDRFGISQDRVWNMDETTVRVVPAGECGWTKRAESAVRMVPAGERGWTKRAE